MLLRFSGGDTKTIYEFVPSFLVPAYFFGELYGMVVESLSWSWWSIRFEGGFCVLEIIILGDCLFMEILIRVSVEKWGKSKLCWFVSLNCMDYPSHKEILWCLLWEALLICERNQFSWKGFLNFAGFWDWNYWVRVSCLFLSLVLCLDLGFI